jgi:hypothetical protein
MSAPKSKCLKMWKGKLGVNAVTHYSAAVVEQARKDGCGLLIINGRGKEVAVPNKKIRLVHRLDLMGVFCDTHDRCGEGKYVHADARKGDKTVVGAHLVMPYLANEFCYASIVRVFTESIGVDGLKGLKAVVKHTRDDGEHLVWQGKRSENGSVVASPWFTKDEVWEMARKMNDSLSRRLRLATSQKKGVKQHLPPKRKFLDNINVMRRARSFINPVTGDEPQLKGGLYPYGMPLEQVGFAIDYCYLTDGFVIETDNKGAKRVVETGDYYLRLVVGRSTPWVMTKNDWAGCGDEDRFAFKSEKIRQAVIEARKRLDKKAKVA